MTETGIIERTKEEWIEAYIKLNCEKARVHEEVTELKAENKKLKRLLEEVSGLKAKNKYSNLTSEQREANLDYNLKAMQGDE